MAVCGAISLQFGEGFIFVQGWVTACADIETNPRINAVLTNTNADSLIFEEVNLFEGIVTYESGQSKRNWRLFTAALTRNINIYDDLAFRLKIGEDTFLLGEQGGRTRFEEIFDFNVSKEGRFTGWACFLGKVPQSIRIRLGDAPAFEVRPHELKIDAAIPMSAIYFDMNAANINKIMRGFDFNFNIINGAEREIEFMLAGSVVGWLRRSFHYVIFGEVEKVVNGGIFGWVCSNYTDGSTLQVDVFIDDVLYETVEAIAHLSPIIDDTRIVASGSFFLQLPPYMWSLTNISNVTVRHFLTGDLLLNGEFSIDLTSNLTRTDTNCLLSYKNIVIIIPIYNAFEHVQRCVESLLENLTLPARVILIDDASTDERVKKFLYQITLSNNFEIYFNEKNIGYTKTINKGLKLAGDDCDAVLLNSDTLLSPRWLENLNIAAYQGENIGTVTPLSNNAGVFSFPEIGVPNFIQNLTNAEIARLVSQTSIGLRPYVPTGHGFCLYITRRALADVGEFDELQFPRGYGEENDFCMRVSRKGLHNIIDDRTIIFHSGSASFANQKAALNEQGAQTIDRIYPEYRGLIKSFYDGVDIKEIRWRIRRALEESKIEGRKIRPRYLFVISTTTGGTPQTNRDLMLALEDNIELYLLRSSPSNMVISLVSSRGDQEVFTHQFREKVTMATHISKEYDDVVSKWLFKLNIELVHCRHMAWHSLNLIHICKSLHVPVVYSFHDFYTICPSIKLLDQDNVFCGGSCTSTEGDCTADLWEETEVPPLKRRFIYRWQELHKNALERCDAFITTSHEARDIIDRKYPSLDLSRRLAVIPHGRTFDRLANLSAEVDGSAVRVLVLGNISVAKGSLLIKKVAEIDAGRSLVFHVLGDPGVLRDGPGIITYGTYNRGSVSAHIGEIRPHMGAIFSIWPETYCHTLSEMWAAGIPVLGLAIGAIRDRIIESGAGWTIPVDSTAEMIVEIVKRIATPGTIELDAARKKVSDWQINTGTKYNTRSMGARYMELYRLVIKKKWP